MSIPPAEDLIALALALNRFLALYYVVLAVLYAYSKEYGKALYWFGAVVLTFGVSMMKG